MKTGIHPKYHGNVSITCVCGNVFVTGSTRENLATEICSACHPFYTGKQKLVDTAKRVDKFEAKRKKAEDIKAKNAKKAKGEEVISPETFEETLPQVEMPVEKAKEEKPKKTTAKKKK